MAMPFPIAICNNSPTLRNSLIRRCSPWHPHKRCYRKCSINPHNPTVIHRIQWHLPKATDLNHTSGRHPFQRRKRYPTFNPISPFRVVLRCQHPASSVECHYHHKRYGPNPRFKSTPKLGLQYLNHLQASISLSRIRRSMHLQTRKLLRRLTLVLQFHKRNSTRNLPILLCRICIWDLTQLRRTLA